MHPRERSASALRRVVIVADNSLIAEAIRIGFRASGEFRLLGKADARTTAAKTIVDAQPDVVLVDDMDSSDRSLELIGELVLLDERLSVIVLSMHMDATWLERAFDAGALGAISKSAQPAALATLVRETLNGNVVHRFRGTGASAPAPDAVAIDDLCLTQRELEILKVVASGLSNGEIARQLWVTEQTVKFHLRNIYRKLGVANRTEASHFAHMNGLVGRGFRVPALTLAS
jgi:DNA-binding NarL/FixJ family response regulator